MNDLLIKDCLESLKRLNDECNSRAKFEQELMDVIQQQKETIEHLRIEVSQLKEAING